MNHVTLSPTSPPPTVCIPPTESLHELLARYALFRGLKKNSAERYASVLNVYLRLGYTQFDDHSVACFRRDRLAAGISPNTVRAEIGKIRAVAKWAGIELSILPPRKVHKQPRAWTREELKQLFAEAEKTNRSIYGIAGKCYWPALLWIAYETGERLTAMMSLTWADIDFKKRLVHFRAETRKFGDTDSLKPISKNTRKALLKLKEAAPWKESDACFQSIWNPIKRATKKGNQSTAQKALKVLLADAGLPTERVNMMHSMRRTHASWLTERGGDATTSLGHSSQVVTRASYIDPRVVGAGRKVLRLLPNPLGWWGRVREWWPW